MPIKVTYQNPGLEYDENMVCEDFLNMGMLPLEVSTDKNHLSLDWLPLFKSTASPEKIALL